MDKWTNEHIQQALDTCYRIVEHKTSAQLDYIDVMNLMYEMRNDMQAEIERLQSAGLNAAFGEANKLDELTDTQAQYDKLLAWAKRAYESLNLWAIMQSVLRDAPDEVLPEIVKEFRGIIK